MNKGFTIPARKVRPLQNYPVADMGDIKSLEKLGIQFHDSAMGQIMAMDSAIVSNLTTASVTTPMQFLQAWLPGFVEVVTQARKIDEIIGVTTIGQWHDEEVVQGISERSGKARLYSDYANMPKSNWNVNFERAQIVRFEHGMGVTRLTEARASAMNYNDAEAKRKGSALSLEISRNEIGFYGFNNGLGRTYGFLNAPGLPAYGNVADGASGDTEWSTKTTLEIIKDLQSALAALRAQTGSLIDPKRDDVTLALPTNCIDRMTTPTELGYSVEEWLQKNYPKVRPIDAPELQAANGGANVFYLFADRYGTDSSDDGLVFTQLVPTKFITLGVDQGVKGYEEDYSNATAGVMCKRPVFVVRRSGI